MLQNEYSSPSIIGVGALGIVDIDGGSANFIVVHMGGGISIGADRKGRVVDVNDALDGDGPSPRAQRLGPTGPLVAACFSGGKTQDEIWKMLVGRGEITPTWGPMIAARSKPRIGRGDAKAARGLRSHGLSDRQVGRGHGGRAVRAKSNAVVFAGGMARSKMLIRLIRKYCGFVAPFLVYPEMEEMVALA